MDFNPSKMPLFLKEESFTGHIFYTIMLLINGITILGISLVIK